MAPTFEQAPRCHSLMLFLMPDRVIAETIAQRCQTDWAPDFRGKRLPWDRLHVTTCLFSQTPDRPDVSVVEDLKAALDEVRFMPFWMGFDWMCSFGAGGKRPRVLASSDDIHFHYFRRSIRDAVTAAGYKDHLRPKHDPHVTMFYERQPAPKVRIDTIGWQVREFVLVDSWVGLTRHEILGRWTLNDPLMSPNKH